MICSSRKRAVSCAAVAVSLRKAHLETRLILIFPLLLPEDAALGIRP
jgi:hypothetical protein